MRAPPQTRRTLPDSPLALSGLDALYLNSQRAVDLEEKQVEALLSWLHGGGHLIVGVDAVIDVNGVVVVRIAEPEVTVDGVVVDDRLDDQFLELTHDQTPPSRSRLRKGP